MHLLNAIFFVGVIPGGKREDKIGGRLRLKFTFVRRDGSRHSFTILYGNSDDKISFVKLPLIIQAVLLGV